MDMQQREYLLHNEALKLQQEADQVTTGLPHSNQEVAQSHRRSTDEKGGDSEVLLIKEIHDEGVPLTQRAPSNEIKNGPDEDVSGQEKEVQHNDQKTKTLNEEEVKDDQGKLLSD
ncbi:inositol 1,4,5-trisphosphate receptor-interacting protein-like, partial [Clarias magur]